MGSSGSWRCFRPRTVGLLYRRASAEHFFTRLHNMDLGQHGCIQLMASPSWENSFLQECLATCIIVSQSVAVFGSLVNEHYAGCSALTPTQARLEYAHLVSHDFEALTLSRTFNFRTQDFGKQHSNGFGATSTEEERSGSSISSSDSASRQKAS